MLDSYTTQDQNKKKAFNVNMLGNKRTLHINTELIGASSDGKMEVFSPKGSRLPYKKCQYQNPFRFISFSSLEEVEAFEKKHACSFTRCGNCFPPEMRGN